jgi:preprotein translocase subunit SecF
VDGTTKKVEEMQKKMIDSQFAENLSNTLKEKNPNLSGIAAPTSIDVILPHTNLTTSNLASTNLNPTKMNKYATYSKEAQYESPQKLSQTQNSSKIMDYTMIGIVALAMILMILVWLLFFAYLAAAAYKHYISNKR